MCIPIPSTTALRFGASPSFCSTFSRYQKKDVINNSHRLESTSAHNLKVHRVRSAFEMERQVIRTHTNERVQVNKEPSIRLLGGIGNAKGIEVIQITGSCQENHKDRMKRARVEERTMPLKQKAQSSLLTRSLAVGTRTFFKSNDILCCEPQRCTGKLLLRKIRRQFSTLTTSVACMAQVVIRHHTELFGSNSTEAPSPNRALVILNSPWKVCCILF